MRIHFSNTQLCVALQDIYQEKVGSRQVHLKLRIHKIEIAAEIALEWEWPMNEKIIETNVTAGKWCENMWINMYLVFSGWDLKGNLWILSADYRFIM